jgi:hypothetical protein
MRARFEWHVFLILLLAVGVRLYQINQPMVDAWAWREADTAMIAENFYRKGFDLLHPRVHWGWADWGQGAPIPPAGEWEKGGYGYIGAEFPLVPALAAALYTIFGIQNWVGRLISVLLLCLSIPYFYALLRKLVSHRSSVVGTLVYAFVPLSVFMGRSFMPDAASLGFTVVALSLFIRWIEDERRRLAFWLSACTLSLAILVKPSAAIVGLPLLYLLWQRFGVRLFSVPRLYGFAMLASGPPIAWYVHMARVSCTHPPYHFFGSGGVGLVPLNSYGQMLERIVLAELTPLVAAVMLVGLVAGRSRGNYGRLFHVWLLAFTTFLVLVGDGNYRHPWYHAACVPIAGALVGLAYERVSPGSTGVWGRRGVALGTVLFLGLSSWLAVRATLPLFHPWGTDLMNLGLALREKAPTDAVPVFVSEGFPVAAYYWGGKSYLAYTPGGDKELITQLEAFRAAGATHYAIPSFSLWQLDNHPEFRDHLGRTAMVLDRGAYGVIYELSRSKRILSEDHSGNH